MLTRRLNLTIKLLVFIVLVSLINALLLMYHTEEQLEVAILDQVKKQAIHLLDETAHSFEQSTVPLNHPSIAQSLHSIQRSTLSKALDFQLRSLYIYDKAGKVLAHSQPGPHKDKPLNSKYGQVLHQDTPFVGQKMEKETDNQGQTHYVLDIILPLHKHGEVVAGLEAELDMATTMARISEMDDKYEIALLKIQTVHTVIFALIFWYVVNRMLIRPIKRVDRVTNAIAEGHLEKRIPMPVPKDEVGRLSRSVNHMGKNIQDLVQAQEEAYLQTLRSLMQALEVKDAYTAGHSARVAKYSVWLGQELGLDKHHLDLLKKGALMHDLGKIGVADAILNKPSPLTDAEYQEMQAHPGQTAEIMRPLKRFKAFAEIAAWHHERWDGKGYPDGLKGEEVPLLARIVSIADTWDAMTGDRVYRKGMPKEKALSILEAEQHSGQWDPQLLGQFITMVKQQEKQGH
ncbi:HD domain-containing phosphohydrolase [Magnetococcus sp. PR-3]|uniref:HD domain-containing phosphohydrolase n=1 Tax=Magnetococcus sp. PR-3 TaxID=3120355 RepID=UPI002FCE30FA